jgi:uncharacterized membrane protein SpoIIM required for sporulation/ABC-type transport system involved in multi-copper enzyme maturation permease subunit
MRPFQRSLLVARRELKDSLTDWRIVTPVSLLTFIFPWVVIYATKFGIGWAERYDPGLVLAQLIPYSVMVVGFFPISFSLVIALESFVGEKERNTLESLLSTPITDGELYLGKLLAALALPLMGSLAAIAIYTANLPRLSGQSVQLDLLLQILCLTVTLALGMVAGAVVVSSNTTSVRAANLLASFIVLPAMLLISFQALIILWDQREVLWYIAGAQALADLALIRMGTRMFNREELLSRTLDRVDIRRTWRTFWAFLSQEPLSTTTGQSSKPLTIGRLYRRDLPQLLRRIGGAVLVVCLLLVGAFILGWLYAQALPLPPQTVEEFNLDSPSLLANWEEIRQNTDLFAQIFGGNLFRLVLFALGGIICFGASSVIPLFVTIGLVGFAAGEAAHLGLNLGQLSAAVWPHGIFEIPAAILLTAAGLRMGASVLAPLENSTLGETLLLGLADFVKLLLLLIVPILLIAAFIEVYVTPQIVFWVMGQ